MKGIVADTHTFLWYLFEPQRLSSTASQSIENALKAGGAIYISAISLIETVYLSEKNRLPSTIPNRLDSILKSSDSEFKVISVSESIAHALRSIARSTVPDMPDRIIAATALEMNLPLVTRDRKIQAAQITTIW